jgi:hypothetical protein
MSLKAFIIDLAGLDEETSRLESADHIACQKSGTDQIKRISPNSILPHNFINQLSAISSLSDTDELLVYDSSASAMRKVDVEDLMVKQNLKCYYANTNSSSLSSISTSYATEIERSFVVPRSGIYLFGGTVDAVGQIKPDSDSGTAHTVRARFLGPDGSYSPAFMCLSIINAQHSHAGANHYHTTASHQHSTYVNPTTYYTNWEAPNTHWASSTSVGTTGVGGIGRLAAGAVSFIIPMYLSAGTRTGKIQMSKTGSGWSYGPYTEGRNIWLVELG